MSPALSNIIFLHPLTELEEQKQRDKRIAELEVELAARCQLHIAKAYPSPRDGLAAMVPVVAEYDQLRRERSNAPQTAIFDTPTPKLDKSCSGILNGARTVSIGQSQILVSLSEGPTGGGGSSPALAPAGTSGIEEFFPWPPRIPTSKWPVAPELFANHATFRTLGNIDHFIREKLEAAGYHELGYFKVKDKGFAVVTKLEIINDKGEPDADPVKRFPISLKPTSSFNLAEYIYRLLFGVKGHYRVFVFIVTPDWKEPQPGAQVDFSLARQWNAKGADSLPFDIQAIPVISRHQLRVLVYEFQYREHDKIPRVAEPNSGLETFAHLRATNIKF
jgi:hypothetical protein